MATTRLRDRIIAGIGAIVFLASASAFTVFVIYDMFTASKDNPQTSSQPVICQANKTEIKLDVPEVVKSDVAVTELKTEDLKLGDGATLRSGDCAVMKYYGTLLKDGSVFDENFTKPSAFAFTFGKGEVIQGWDQGLVGMKVGGSRRLQIPASLGYGEKSSDKIPSNSDLVFVVELLRIKK